MRQAGSGVLRGMIGEKEWTDMNPWSSPIALIPRVCGVMSTRIGPTSTAGDQAALDGRAHGHGQVGLDLRVHGTAQPLLQKLVDQRGAGAPPTRTTLSIWWLAARVGQGFVETRRVFESSGWIISS